MERWRGEPTNEAWAQIAPLLPENGGRSKQWRDHRTLVNENLMEAAHHDAPWRDLLTS